MALDNTLVIEDVKLMCGAEASGWSPLLLFIPLRLGLTDINSLYFNDLKVKAIIFKGANGAIVFFA